MAASVRLLSAEDVRRALEGVDLIGLMEDALGALSAGGVTQPVRMAVSLGPERNVMGLMPAHLHASGALGTKILTVFNGNASRGLPSHHAAIVLADDQTGQIRAVMDGSYITEMRTAAVSGVAVRHLSRLPVRRLGVFGCGVQAGSHVRLLAAAHPTLEAVRIFSAYGDPAACAHELARETGLSCVSVATGAEAARGADVVVLATASDTPVIERAWVDEGTLVICVGACRPNQREMDPALVAASRLVVDSRDAAMIESGDIVQGIRDGVFGAEHVLGELGDVAAGRLRVRRGDADIVVFKSLGLAVEDVATADVAWRVAAERNLGTLAAL